MAEFIVRNAADAFALAGKTAVGDVIRLELEQKFSVRDFVMGRLRPSTAVKALIARLNEANQLMAEAEAIMDAQAAEIVKLKEKLKQYEKP
jgi:hypothetical protein